MDYINEIKWHPEFPDYGADRSGTIWSKKINPSNKSGEVRKQKICWIDGCGMFNLYNVKIKTVKRNIRFIWECFYSPLKMNEVVCVKNKNATDNRLDNLELKPLSVVLRYQGKIQNKSSKYKGVHFNKNTQRWGVHVSFGSFATEEEAARAYDAAALGITNKDMGLLK